MFFVFKEYGDDQDLPFFPTRRSSDLHRAARIGHIDSLTLAVVRVDLHRRMDAACGGAADEEGNVEALALHLARDRKSTRLNSSHANISYAVFCLKKKKS